MGIDDQISLRTIIESSEISEDREFEPRFGTSSKLILQSKSKIFSHIN